MPTDTPPAVAEPAAETDAEARRPPAAVDWDRVKRVHLMGICGSAMGAFAGMLRLLGMEVRGSDKGAYPPMSTHLEQMGVQIMEGYNGRNLDWGPDVVVVGNVIRPSYEEAVALRRRAIPHCSLPQALAGLFIGEKRSVVVTGTHGKTTTSSMTAWLLHEAGLDPGFMIGGLTGNFGTNHRVTQGDIFVVEGDEYDTAYFDKGPKFLHYRPLLGSINNIEFDHADIYADVDAVEASFVRFARLMPPHGVLLAPLDDPRALRVARLASCPVWTFGSDASADVRATSVRADDRGTHFVLSLPKSPDTPVSLPLWGAHNVSNALTAAGLARAAGASADAIAAGLSTFSLPRKRQELRGVAGGVPVIDDFAHHPTAIRETLRAMRTRWPDRRLLALFEVESNTSRRRVFQDGFAAALGAADRVWFCRPHDKDDGLPPEARLDMGELIEAIRASGTEASMLSSTEVLAKEVAEVAEPGRDAIIAMSGRDFHGIHARLLELLSARHPEAAEAAGALSTASS